VSTPPTYLPPTAASEVIVAGMCTSSLDQPHVPTPTPWLRCRTCKALSHRDHARRCMAGDDHCTACGSREVDTVDLAAQHQARKRAAMETT
jgi:hypothetical protein